MLAALLGLLAGCGDSAPPGPGIDGGLRDSGSMDGGAEDGAIMDEGTADADALDAEPVDLGETVDGGATDGGTLDEGVVDAGAPVGSPPVIANIAWTIAQDGSCGPNSGLLFSVVVNDPDTDAFFLTPTVTGMGTCFLSDVDTATDMVDITLTNCPHDRDYTPTVRLTDPDGNSASVSGFTVGPCSNGAHFP